jgi:decaprenyl-phosphate phosphoribosyltransferase
LIIAGATVVALLAYCVWAFSLPAVRGIPWRPLTILPFAACLLRYGRLVRAGAGEAPEDVLLSDRPLQLAGLLWLALFVLEVHAAS